MMSYKLGCQMRVTKWGIGGIAEERFLLFRLTQSCQILWKQVTYYITSQVNKTKQNKTKQNKTQNTEYKKFYSLLFLYSAL